jgi:LacI family transcriptional regulator
LNRFSETVQEDVVKTSAADRQLIASARRSLYAWPVSPGAKRVTIREVADAAGVSQAAVSYALRGINVSEETQERVRKVAADMGYEANPIARALASGRSGMVGILGPSLEDLWQQRFAAEAGRALHATTSL